MSRDKVYRVSKNKWLKKAVVKVASSLQIAISAENVQSMKAVCKVRLKSSPNSACRKIFAELPIKYNFHFYIKGNFRRFCRLTNPLFIVALFLYYIKLCRMQDNNLITFNLDYMLLTFFYNDSDLSAENILITY